MFLLQSLRKICVFTHCTLFCYILGKCEWLKEEIECILHCPYGIRTSFYNTLSGFTILFCTFKWRYGLQFLSLFLTYSLKSWNIISLLLKFYVKFIGFMNTKVCEKKCAPHLYWYNHSTIYPMLNTDEWSHSQWHL